MQVSAKSHAPAAARHTVLAGWKVSPGQPVLVPSQVSAASQVPAAGRHTVPAWPAGCWHVSLAPLQVSVVHGFPSSVHAVPFGFFTSAGQAALVPVQVSARSHSPAAARHVVLAGWNVSAGQSLATPSQLSATSQAPAAGRHTAVLFASAGLVVLVPVQASATSHAPAAGRHTAPAFPAGCWQVALAPSH